MEKNQLLEIAMTQTPEEIFKAVKDAKGLEGIRIIKDLWEDMHVNPERNDTKTGPAMHSSGAGADKAIASYSNPAPQVGLTELYEEFTRKNIEGWGNLYTSMKSMGDKFETGMAALLDHLKKAEEKEEKKEEKKEEAMKGGETGSEKEEWKKEEKEDEKDKMKGAEPAANPDPVTKAKIAASWDDLSELLTAFSKAEDEKKDIEGLEEARHHIEKAEKELEKVEEHEKEEQAHMKANVYINLGWRSLAKATGLSTFDLKGYGNQKDEAVTGDSTSDQSKHDLKKAESKASYYATQADRIRKSLGLKKDETVVAPVAAATTTPAAPAPTEVPSVEPAATAEVEALKAEMTNMQKAFNDRITLINQRVEDVTGRKMTPMVPVILKSAGIKSDNVAQSLNEKIEASVEAGLMSEDNAGVARSLVGRYMAVGKGHMLVDIVNQQLQAAPLEVQNFFSHLEATV